MPTHFVISYPAIPLADRVVAVFFQKRITKIK